MSPAAPRDAFIRVDGLRVRWFERGRGAAVLLLHGASLGSSADVWTRNLDALAAHGLRVIAFDQPGFGLSGDPQDRSVAFRTRFVSALMDALGLPRAHLIGHSQSGRIVLSLALTQPQRLLKAVIVGTGSLLPPLPGVSAGDAAEGDDGGVEEPTLEQTRQALADTLYHPEAITPEALGTRHRMSTGRNFRAFVERRRMRGGDKGGVPLWQRLGEVSVPLRLIYGTHDRGNTAERAALARERWPALDIHLVERCKHLVQWDAPEEFARLAGGFLAG
jgi:pimeloyl-ACP methyl ester carboxylesterase